MIASRQTAMLALDLVESDAEVASKRAMFRHYMFLAARVSVLIGLPLSALTLWQLYQWRPDLPSRVATAVWLVPVIEPLLILHGLPYLARHRVELREDRICVVTFGIRSSIRSDRVKSWKLHVDRSGNGFSTLVLKTRFGGKRAYSLPERILSQIAPYIEQAMSRAHGEK